MATPYCDFTHFQYSFSAEGACQKFKKWRARLFSRLRNFAAGLAKVSLSEAIRLRFCRFPKRTEEKPQDGVNPLFSPNFRNEERKR